MAPTQADRDGAPDVAQSWTAANDAGKLRDRAIGFARPQRRSPCVFMVVSFW